MPRSSWAKAPVTAVAKRPGIGHTKPYDILDGLVSEGVVTQIENFLAHLRLHIPSGSGESKDRNIIRLCFQHQGKRYRETLRINGEAMPPTPATAKYAKSGEFVFAEYFPESVHAEEADKDGTLGEFMDHRYEHLNVKTSTKLTYQRMKDNFWKPVRGQRKTKSSKHSGITKALTKAKEENVWSVPYLQDPLLLT